MIEPWMWSFPPDDGIVRIRMLKTRKPSGPYFLKWKGLNMITGIEFMGFDFVVDVYYKVTSKGGKETYSIYGWDPADGPEFEIMEINMWRDEPTCRATSKTPMFAATGELFNVLANLAAIRNAVEQDIIDGGLDDYDDDDYQRRRDDKNDADLQRGYASQRGWGE